MLIDVASVALNIVDHKLDSSHCVQEAVSMRIAFFILCLLSSVFCARQHGITKSLKIQECMIHTDRV